MAQECNIDVVVKTTWVKPVSLLICKYVKKRWVLKLVSNLTIARIYVKGRMQEKIKLSDIVEI